MQSLIKFQSAVPEIQMKRAKRDLHTLIHTEQPSHRVSYKLTKNIFGLPGD